MIRLRNTIAVAWTVASCTLATAAHAGSIAIEGATVHVAPGKRVDNAVVLIRDGKIAAVGAAGTIAIPVGARRINATGKVITAGLVEASTTIGLVEVGAVEDTVEGSFHSDTDIIHAAYNVVDGYNSQSLSIPLARTGGITSVVTAPRGGLVSGAAAWITLADALEVGSVTVRAPLAMYATLGRGARKYGDGARGAALERLRELFEDVAEYSKRLASYERNQTRKFSAERLDLAALLPVLRGTMPLVVRCDRAADILALLRLAKELRLRIILTGGTEAWMVADQLAAAKVPVIVSPTANLPDNFDELHVRDDNAALLRAAGVTVAISSLGGAAHIRSLRQRAGIAVAYGMSWDDALAAITSAPADMFGVADRGRLEKGNAADLVIWSGDPFELSTAAEQIFIGGVQQSLRTRQTRLLERYRKRK